MKPVEIIKKEQELLEKTVLTAINYFEQQTGMTILSLGTVKTEYKHQCGKNIHVELNITYDKVL